MKKIFYSLLLTTAITGSAVLATQQAPQRPTTGPKLAPQRPTTALPHSKELKTDNTICPDELNMTQLNEIKDGKLKLGDLKFDLHTSKTEFDAMLPGKMQVISKAHSVAKIAEGVGKGRAIIPTPTGRILKCTYSFRTALASKTAGDHKFFAIKSEPTKFEKDLPKGLTEAIVGGG